MSSHFSAVVHYMACHIAAEESFSPNCAVDVVWERLAYMPPHLGQDRLSFAERLVRLRSWSPPTSRSWMRSRWPSPKCRALCPFEDSNEKRRGLRDSEMCNAATEIRPSSWPGSPPESLHREELTAPSSLFCIRACPGTDQHRVLSKPGSGM